jgi:dienelactone hydrolase
LDVGAGDVDGVKGLFFTSPVTYNGKQTKVAAYIGFPEGASAENKVPAIVLVHGGEGTAIPEWVRYWNKQGFAAISLDTEGAEPIIGVSNYKNYHVKNRYKNDEVYTAGPSNAGFTDCDKPLEEQWMYHATSATILATSLISSFDCVDQQKIGITGISWGSVITTIVCAYDDRLTFAMPVYGAATLTENDGFVKFGKTEASIDAALQYWNVKAGLKNSSCKMFFVAAQTGDTAFSVNVANDAAMLTNGLTLFKDGFSHSQESGANEKNLPDFAKNYCGLQADFVELLQQPSKGNLSFRYTSYGNVKIKSVTVCYTTKAKLTTNTEWTQTTEVVNGSSGSYRMNVPANATFAFARIKYNDGKEISTRIVNLQ